MFERRTKAGCLAVLLLAARPAIAEEWFDAYEHGIAALRKGHGAQAVEFLKRAIQKHPEPGMNLITYGTNRIERYHPYLRLAEAYLLAGDLESARETLLLSEKIGGEPAAERLQLRTRLATVVAARTVRATPLPATPLPPTPPPSVTPVAVTLATPIVAPTISVGTLDLRSEPTGATVLLEGRLLGVTPLIMELPAGAYRVTLRQEGYVEQRFVVRVVANRRASERRKLEVIATSPSPSDSPSAATSVIVYSDPPGSLVYVDDQPLGATDPLSGRLVMGDVAPGMHRIRLSLSGYRDVIRTIEIASTGPTVYRGKLEALQASRIVSEWVMVGLFALLLLLAWTLFRRRARRAAQMAASERLSPADSGVASYSRALGRPSAPPRNLPSTPPDGGEIFGEYLLLEQLGKGGMAAVFRAERHGEIYALKRPLVGLLEDQEFLQRFLREADIGRTLHHPNIIRIFERGEVQGIPYFTMELVDGQNLSQRLREQGRLDPVLSASFVYQIAEALDYAHLKGVVHRDLKPSNVMLARDGTVKVMDYGIARARRFEGLTITGVFLGTPDYVAPETAEGRGTDGRSDLYSLGVIFFEMLTGQRPFVGETPFATLKKHCQEPPTPPSQLAPGIPDALEAIVLRLLCKEPEERYASAEDLLIELRAYLDRSA